MPSRIELLTQRLINQERKRKRIPPVKWSPEMYHLAKNHSKKMARTGRLFHTGHLEGGENCGCIRGGNGHSSPEAFVKMWMESPLHRKALLDYRIEIAAVGISWSRHGTFATWSFRNGKPDDSEKNGVAAILYFPFWLFRELLKTRTKKKPKKN